MFRKNTNTLTLSLLMAALSGCAKEAPLPLRFGLLPDSDSLPFMVAKAEGLFEAQGLSVELVQFTSPVERDAAFQAGAVDGVISDLIAAALATQGGFDVRVTSVTDGRYGIVSAPGGSAELNSLKGKAVGLSSNTIIQYLVDTAIERAGMARGDIERMAVPKIPVRMELLVGGQVAAAGLPEPFLTVAQQRGAALIASCEEYKLDAAIVLFDKKALDAKAGAITKLYKAYWQAAQKINANPDAYRDFLVHEAKFPAETRDAFVFVSYRKPVLPALQNVEAALAWMRGNGLLTADLEAKSLLDDRALRGW
ncbi:MAG TPA: ABC transporter substrate-binding protein [Spirochaetaceae bacterium]|nr:ABC transporter substrate-binding protein [Spirochaetaceae bacterium]